MIWVDLDGVLVNFNKALCQALNVPYPKATVFHYDWMGTQVSMSPVAMFEKAHENPRFWSDMEPFALTAQFVAFLNENAPEWGILTSAWRHEYCYSGKFNWVSKNLGRREVGRLVMVSGNKERLATPTSLLIDDTRHNIDAWIEAGGKGFHWVDYSEDQTVNLQHQLDACKTAILRFKQTHG